MVKHLLSWLMATRSSGLLGLHVGAIAAVSSPLPQEQDSWRDGGTNCAAGIRKGSEHLSMSSLQKEDEKAQWELGISLCLC